ncbi:hypothetical protein MMC29_003676 [Sticta canariensis]|nr:hypothetical protein [Sticta canariensis]
MSSINDDDRREDDGYWWYSPAASAIKWAVIGAVFLIALLWFVGGYYHAQRRMKRGLRPLAYHRWLLPRSQRARFPPHNVFSIHQQQAGYNDGYQMQSYPPPAYDSSHAPPPAYQPPQGASKINPSQEWGVPPSESPVPGESSSTGQMNRPPPIEASSNAASTGSIEAQQRPVRPNLMKRLNPFK